MALVISKGTKLVKYKEEHSFLTNNDTISTDCFRDNVHLTEVWLPEGITRILEGSFAGCERLTSVTIPASVKVIEQNAFAGCEDLKTINLSELVVEIEHWFGTGVKINISKEDLVDYLKEGKEVNLLSEEDIDHWA